MIELPHEFLNVLFMLLIVFASVNRSRQRSAWDRMPALQSMRTPGLALDPPKPGRKTSRTATEPSGCWRPSLEPRPAPSATPQPVKRFRRFLRPRRPPGAGNSFLAAALTIGPRMEVNDEHHIQRGLPRYPSRLSPRLNRLRLPISMAAASMAARTEAAGMAAARAAAAGADTAVGGVRRSLAVWRQVPCWRRPTLMAMAMGPTAMAAMAAARPMRRSMTPMATTSASSW